jgi:hypothetical protein
VKERLKLLDKIEDERRIEAEVTHFNTEWEQLLPVLKRQYPNAGDAELAEAKKIMDEIAHSPEGGIVVNEKQKILKPYGLDYLLFKNSEKFNTLLKLAKGKKSGEGASKEIVEVDDDQEIDLDPENMTPEKFKRSEQQKLKNHETEKPRLMG